MEAVIAASLLLFGHTLWAPGLGNFLVKKVLVQEDETKKAEKLA